MKNYLTITIIMIIAIVFTACSRTSPSSTGSPQQQTATAHPEPVIDPRIPQHISAVIQKHFNAIEDGDLTAFRSTLKEPEDGSDINYQMYLITKYFGELFNTDIISLYDAFTDGGNELDRIRQAAFSGVFPARSRNTGMVIQEIQMGSGNYHYYNDFILVRIWNRLGEEFEYHITIYDGLIDRQEVMSTAGFDPSGLSDSSDPYDSILRGDLFDFAGMWVNGLGEKRQLRANGTFNDGEIAYGFVIGNENDQLKLPSDQHISGTNYQWIVNMGGEAGAFEVWFFPAGADIRNHAGEIIPTDKTKDRIVTEIIRSGNEVYYQVQPHQILHNVVFNNVTIPMNVYYFDYERGWHILDKLVFVYDGKEQIISHQYFENMMPFFDPNPNYYIDIDDYNFDRYMDISVLMMTGSGGSVSAIFLYNPQTKSYYLHEELSQLWTVWADQETQTVKSHGKGGHAGMIYNYSEYKWVNGQLTLIHSVNQDLDHYNQDMDMYIYIRTTRTLQNNRWEEITQRFTEAQLVEE